MKKIFAAALACGLVGMIGTTPALSKDHTPKGNAYGYWAGRLCDHIVNEDGATYWEDRNYPDRGTCVELEGQSLARGEWDPADWPDI